MAVQKRRQSSARRDHRRSQWMAKVAVPNITTCPNCGEPKAAHRVCLKCGQYDGRQVVEVAEEDKE
jgi:large subunit ribosomal protein L32